MALPTLYIIFVCAFGTVLLLKLLRLGWMTRLARAALRRALSRMVVLDTCHLISSW